MFKNNRKAVRIFAVAGFLTVAVLISLFFIPALKINDEWKELKKLPESSAIKMTNMVIM